MNADGSNLNRPGIFNRAQWPAWSPDGKSILYVVQTQAVIPHSDIYIHDLASDQSRLVPGAGAHSWVGLGAKAAWSPDGSKIAFTRAGGWLEVINPDGTGRAQLTSKGYNDFSIDIKPTWSPDGRKIAFQRIYSPGWGQSNESEIWVVDSIGGLPSLQSERRLTRLSSGTLSHDGHFQGAPSWGSVPTVPVAPPIVR
jgi:Tol biopolymer transport system component